MPQIAAVLIAAALLGALAATAGILFIDTAAAASEWQRDGGIALLLAPAAAGVVCALLAKRLPGAIFLGLADMVLQEQRGGSARLRHHLTASAASFVALVGGASVGQYGPVAHLGGALASVYKGLPPRTAAACGIAAAVAAAFNAPFTALVFAHEVVLRHYSLRSFTPVAVAAVVGYSVSAGVFGRPLFLELPAMAALSPLLALLFIVMGLLFGALAAAYLRGIFWLAGVCRPLPLLARLPAAGLAAGLLALWLPEIAGGGKALLESAVAGLPPHTAALLLAAKLAATILCLGAGFAGGVVSPTLAAGALAGLLFFHAAAAIAPGLTALAPAGSVALAGMMALTAPVIGAPLAGILFTMELSGSYPVAIAAAVAIAVAVQTMARLGGASYYDRQLAMRGIDIRLRRDEWLMQTETIAPLATRRGACTLPPDTALPAALAAAAAAQQSVVHIVDEDGTYRGGATLPAMLTAQQNGAATLAADTPPPPLLLSTDTLHSAMQKLAAATGDSAAVIDGGGAFVGILDKGALLSRYDDIVRTTRAEETAV